jgi:hypothetical protein
VTLFALMLLTFMGRKGFGYLPTISMAD